MNIFLKNNRVNTRTPIQLYEIKLAIGFFGGAGVLICWVICALFCFPSHFLFFGGGEKVKNVISHSEQCTTTQYSA